MDPGEKKKRATYQDILDAPEHKVAEIIDGDLHLSRPANPATIVISALTFELGPPFHRGKGGPGGWIILFEPELHLGDDVLVPDLAGWRRERLPVVADAPFIEATPDWVCEVLSPSTEKVDRIQKLPIYARAGISYAWLVHPRRRTLEAFKLRDGHWVAIASLKDDDRARIEPFDAIEIDLAQLWADLPLPSRAGEEAAEYELSSPA